MLQLVIILYVLGAAVPLLAAAAVVRRALRHGPTLGGLDAFVKSVLVPKQAWIAFGLIAAGVVATTVASILSLFLP